MTAQNEALLNYLNRRAPQHGCSYISKQESIVNNRLRGTTLLILCLWTPAASQIPCWDLNSCLKDDSLMPEGNHMAQVSILFYHLAGRRTCSHSWTICHKGDVILFDAVVHLHENWQHSWKQVLLQLSLKETQRNSFQPFVFSTSLECVEMFSWFCVDRRNCFSKEL